MNNVKDEFLEAVSERLWVVESLEDIRKIAEKVAEERFPEMSASEKKKLVNEIASYGIVQKYIDDPNVEDIMINSLKQIYIFHSKEGMVRTEDRFASMEELHYFIRKLLVFSGKKVLKGINDLHLPEGQRANIVQSPLGPHITIRMFKERPPSIIDLIRWKVLDHMLAAQLWMYVEGLSVKPANILVVGPPASGKTTLLNALFSFFPINQRTVVIEDTLELNTETEENCARLVSNDEMSIKDLVKNSLRMRPDRIVIGEVRGEEARDLMTAMNIGKICMGTLHATNCREAVIRLQNEPMLVPPQLIPLIDVIVAIGKFNVRGRLIRRISEVTEVAGIEGKEVLLSRTHAYDFAKGMPVKTSPSVTYRDRLAAAAGVSPKKVMEEVERRAAILLKLDEKNVTDMKDIARFCKRYQENPDEALEKLG